jgi:hypothetical protein
MEAHLNRVLGALNVPMLEIFKSSELAWYLNDLSIALPTRLGSQLPHNGLKWPHRLLI